MTKGRGGDGACVLEEEGRGRDSVVWRCGGVALAIRRRWHVMMWEMTQLVRVGRMVGRMRYTVNYDF
jgi:hypothetical protein